MASASKSRDGRVKPLTITRLASEMLSTLTPPRVDRPTYREMERAFEAIGRMEGVETSAELVPTPDWVARFLDSHGGSTRRKAVGRSLIRVGNILDYAVMSSRLEPSDLVLFRPIPIPPEWDEDDPRFARGGQAAPSRRPLEFPPPSWGDFVRVMSAMAADSFAWPVARLYVLASTVAVARLNWSEALAIEVNHYRPRDGGFHLTQRSRLRKGRPEAANPVEVPPPLGALWDRWIPRTHGRYAFPLLSRSGPWHRPTASRNLAEFAIKVLGKCEASDRFTPGGLFAFGRAYESILSDPERSPLAIRPGDTTTLRPSAVTISRLREEVDGSKVVEQNKSRRIRILDRIDQMTPKVATAADLTPEFLGRFMAEVGITGPIPRCDCGKLREPLKSLRTICFAAIELGGIDVDPFEGRPGIDLRRRKPRTAAPQGLRTRRSLFLSLARESTTPIKPDSRSPAEPKRKCPVELKGEGFPILVYGQAVPRLTGIAYSLLEFAVDRFQQGGVCAASELAERTTSTSSNPIKSLTLKLKEPGFEPLARVVLWDGKKGGTLRIIDPGLIT